MNASSRMALVAFSVSVRSLTTPKNIRSRSDGSSASRGWLPVMVYSPRGVTGQRRSGSANTPTRDVSPIGKLGFRKRPKNRKLRGREYE